jgi:DNA-binding transcriptional MerR regulator
MRISDIVQRTGLTKKTIYYYIHEGLLSPARESKNGYLIFTDEDIVVLQAICKLRALDISVEDIRSILAFPNTANYYFVKQLKELSGKTAKLEWQKKCIENILDSIHPESNREGIFALLDSFIIKGKGIPAENAIDTTDAQLMAAYFWGTFMHGIEMTEYRRFLWNRLINYIVIHQSPEMIGLRNFLYSLSPQETQTVFAQRSELIEQIASLTESDFKPFILKMITAIIEQLNNPVFIKSWKKHYTQFIHPSTCFYDSPASEIMRDFSPRFSSYQRNVNACCSGILNYIQTPEGCVLHEELTNKLKDYFDLNGHHSGEFAALFSFQNSTLA